MAKDKSIKGTKDKSIKGSKDKSIKGSKDKSIKGTKSVQSKNEKSNKSLKNKKPKSVAQSAPKTAPKPGTSMATALPKSVAPSAKSAPSGPPPSLDQVINGQSMTAEQIAALQKSGALPMGINASMMPTMHKVKNGNEEMLVVMIDAPPCGCRKVNGKKERCRLHRREKRTKKKAKKAAAPAGPTGPQMVKDDGSDRMKLGALRHAEDSDEERETPINGALTPDEICIVGPAGVGMLIPIDSTGNSLAGPRAPKDFPPMKGINVKGPQDCPQFIPDDKVPKNEKGEPKVAAFVRGTLVKGINGAVFYRDGGNKWNEQGKPQNIVGTGIDADLQAKIGNTLHFAGTVDVNETGIPEFRLVDEQHPAPQDKFATLGVMIKVDEQLCFVQSKGQTVGSGDASPCVPPTREGAVPAGTILGDVIFKEGRLFVVLQGQAAGAEIIGTIVQGDWNQPIFLPKKGGLFDKNGVVCENAATASIDDLKALVAKDEGVQIEHFPKLSDAYIYVVAVLQGKNVVEVKATVEAEKANTEQCQEVQSVSLTGGKENRSVFCYIAQRMPQQPGGPAPEGPYVSGGGADATSQFMSVDASAPGNRSVFVSGEFKKQ